MLNKTHKFVTVFMVMLLVLGLALVACKAPAETVTPPAPPEEQATPPAPPEQQAPPEEQATPPAAAELSYEAKTYTNSEYGFSIQYVADWEARPEIAVGTIVAAFGVSAFVPGVSLSVRDADAPLTADWIVAANTAEGNTKVKVTSDLKETILFDGTPAIEYTCNYDYQGYEITSFNTSTDKNGKRIRSCVWTIDAFSPYDETLFSEVAHTLSVK
jgi:hypothetical protein